MMIKTFYPKIMIGLLALGGYFLMGQSASFNIVKELPNSLHSVALEPAVINLVDLIDHTNKPVTKQRLEGRWTFVFFGFTHCPHVCPATLTQLGVVKKNIDSNEQAKNNVQYFFISVDPDRDTVARLSEYMSHFSKDFVGMRGRAEDIVVLEKQMLAFHRIVDKGAEKNYDVDHSAEVYLINPKGELVAKFQPPMQPVKVAEQFYELLDYYKHT